MPNDRNTTSSLLASLPELIDGIRPHLLLDLLKDRAEISAVVLSGFRPVALTLRMPVVKQRLMREIERDQMLFDSVTAMWVESNQTLWGRIALAGVKELDAYLNSFIRDFGASNVKIALLLDDRESVRSLAEKLGTSDAAPVKPEARPRTIKRPEPSIEPLKAENTELRGKIKELQQSAKDLERRLQESQLKLEKERGELKTARQQLVESQKQSQKSEKLAERLRRAKEAADYEIASARRDLKRAGKELKDSKANKPSVSPIPLQVAADNSWTRTISKLIRDGAFDVAKTFCESLKELDLENIQAHVALEQIYAKTGDKDRQIEECNWIAMFMSKDGHPVRACAFACRALVIDPTQHRVQLQFRRVLESISLTDEATVSGIRRLIARLKLSNPLAYRQACKVMKQIGRNYAKALEGPHETLHLDKVFSMTDGKTSLQLSIHRIIDAMNSNEASLVEFIQQALPNLRRTRPTLFRQIIENLERHDRSIIATITSKTSPIVVDGSNVAWCESENKAQLQNILDLRTELRLEGFFPIYIYIDASLPYQIDQPSALQQLINSAAIIEVDSRTDADETILARARSLGCPIVSNDRMVDWDPTGEVSKIKVAIDAHGIMIYGR